MEWQCEEVVDDESDESIEEEVSVIGTGELESEELVWRKNHWRAHYFKWASFEYTGYCCDFAMSVWLVISKTTKINE